jgi:hypothetical protein
MILGLVNIGDNAVDIAGILQNRELYDFLLEKGFKGVCAIACFPITG